MKREGEGADDSDSDSDSLPSGPPSHRVFTDDDSLEVVESDADCRNCEHFAVCGVANRFAAVLEEATNDDPPMSPGELAKVCDAYAPES